MIRMQIVTQADLAELQKHAENVIKMSLANQRMGIHRMDDLGLISTLLDLLDKCVGCDVVAAVSTQRIPVDFDKLYPPLQQVNPGPVQAETGTGHLQPLVASSLTADLIADAMRNAPPGKITPVETAQTQPEQPRRGRRPSAPDRADLSKEL